MKQNKKRIQGLNGLRVYAIAMIVACHVGALADTAGGIGNKIFFTLSGFLAYYSIRGIKNWKDIFGFYWKKILRIVPVFWVIILIVWRMFPGTFSLRDLTSDNSLVLNCLFIKNRGHLWFLQHLMLMYLFTPVLWYINVLIESVLMKLNNNKIVANIFSAIGLIAIAILEKTFLTSDIIALSGEGSHSQFQIWMFIMGFATAILGEVVNGFVIKDSNSKFMKIGKAVSAIYATAVVALLFISVVPVVYERGALWLLGNDYLRAILSCGIFLFFLIFEENVVTRILDSKVLNQLSVLSFGIYLWHFYFISLFRTESGLHNFIFNFFISLCLSIFTYIVVERNVSRLSKKVRSILGFVNP